MEIKIFPVLVCALILLWTTQKLHGYTGQWNNYGNRGSGRKKNEISQNKVSLQKHVFSLA